MSIHQKMQSDYLWIRHAPVEEGLKTRNHGFYYLYHRAPNSVERLEMIYRSIGKQYDWDLQKFRLGRKGVDRGNKRRFLKNGLRFMKHPLGYLHWKLYSFFRVPPRIIVLMLGFTIALSFLEFINNSNTTQANNNFLTGLGKNVEEGAGRMQGYHHRAKIRSFNVFDTFLKAPLTSDQVILNPAWRQNLRKQLHLTNSYHVSFL